MIWGVMRVEFDVGFLLDHSMWFLICMFGLVLVLFSIRRVRTFLDRYNRKKDEERRIVY